MTNSIEYYQQQYKTQQLVNKEIPWLQQIREQAIQQFSEVGFPTLRNEAWKYTKVNQIEKRVFELNSQQKTDLDTNFIKQNVLANSHCLVFVDGFLRKDLSTNISDEAISIESIAAAISQDSNSLKAYFNVSASQIKHGFAALNTAFMQDGACIRITKNAQVATPIELVFITTEQENRINHPRNLIIVEENAQATLIERYVSTSSAIYFNNIINEIILKPNSQLEHYKIQQENQNSFHIATTQVLQQRDSQYQSYVFSFGGKLVRSDINVNLADTGAYCDLQGLYITKQRQHMDFHTFIKHAKPHGTSREFYKGILAEHSHAIFNGKVYVDEGAIKTDAEQSNKNLLLADNAEIDTKPELEIYNDDVKCAHGATVGQLDETALFYMRSRGISKATAKQLLVYAFAREMVDAVKHDELREQLVASLQLNHL